MLTIGDQDAVNPTFRTKLSLILDFSQVDFKA
jgi:hypothetical protein